MTNEVYTVNAQKGILKPWATFEQVFSDRAMAYDKCKELERGGWNNVEWTKHPMSLEEFHNNRIKILNGLDWNDNNEKPR